VFNSNNYLAIFLRIHLLTQWLGRLQFDIVEKLSRFLYKQ